MAQFTKDGYSYETTPSGAWIVKGGGIQSSGIQLDSLDATQLSRAASSPNMSQADKDALKAIANDPAKLQELQESASAAQNESAAKTAAATQPAEPANQPSEPLSDKEASAAGGQNAATLGQTESTFTPYVQPPVETKSETINQQNTIIGTTSNLSETFSQDANEKQQQLTNTISLLYKNKLHDYTGYTYRVTLFLLTKEDYLSMTENPSKFDPKHSLISGGGGYATDAQVNTTRRETGFGGYTDETTTTKGRHPDFQEDFFIENLQLQTVVGLNAKTKASNAIDISFSIIEPYGMTLLDRLLSACEVTAKSSNYIDQPYLLEIDFLSNVDEQQKTTNKPSGLLIDRKRIAIKFLEMKIKPGLGGTEYRVKAIPYNHVAFSQSAAALPINLSVEAKTVGEFFNSDAENEKIFGKSLSTNQERVESELQKWIDANTVVFANIKPTQAQIDAKRKELEASLSYTTNSLPAGYNEYMRSISTKGKLFTSPQTLISFKIDPAFANSPIVDPDKTEVVTQPMTPSLEGINAIIPGYQNPEHKIKQVYNIHAGTDIVTIIDRIMQSSKYIKDQVLNAKRIQEEEAQQSASRDSTNTKQYKYLDWYKIIPQVRLLSFDESRNAYSKQIIYNIVPFRTANSYHPDFKKTKVSKNKIARSYQYLYTGKNEDVINVDIDFDTMFYTQLTTFQENKRRAGTNYLANSPFLNPVQARDGADSNRTQDIPIQYNAIGSEQQASSGFNRGKDPNDQAIASLTKSIYTSSRGDMLNLKLKIVGDPGFIKQDDIYYNPSSSEYAEYTKGTNNNGEQVPINLETGQILFDQEQIYVQFITKNAVDIDDTTGITNKQIKLSNGRITNSSFSGVYKVLKVSSELTRGKFEQVLELVKMPNDIMFDDTAKTNEATVVNTPPSQEPQPSTNFVSPPPAPVDTPAVPPIGENLRLAGASPALNPIPGLAGAGALSSFTGIPSTAAPTNINQTEVPIQLTI